uniref:Conserved domain protein n=1 Tax=Parastrongyloides trichosuri TaxID=131310 RepID=A0A0N4ZCW8_PARTI
MFLTTEELNSKPPKWHQYLPFTEKQVVSQTYTIDKKEGKTRDKFNISEMEYGVTLNENTNQS